MDHLAAGQLGLADDLRHFGIVVLEDFVQQKRCPFLRAKAFKNRKKRDRDFVGELALHFRRKLIDDGLGQPRPNVLFALLLQVPKAVEAKARGDGNQKGNR